jgi:GMP synthase-like glutamine amidotransferase
MEKNQVLVVDFGTRHLNSLISALKEFVPSDRIRLHRVTRPDEQLASLKFDLPFDQSEWTFGAEMVKPSDKGIIFSGSSDSVGSIKGYRSLNPGVLRSVKVPMLGICYGHQLIATTTIGDDKVLVQHGEHGNTMFLPNEDLSNDLLFKNLPKAGFMVAVRHNWSIPEVPRGYRSLGESRSAHTVISVIKAIDRPIYGLQFHPELPVPGYWSGRDMLANFTEMSLIADTLNV